MPKKVLKYKELKEQLESQKEAIDLVLANIATKDPNDDVEQDQLEDYELMMDSHQPGKAEMTGRARVSC